MMRFLPVLALGLLMGGVPALAQTPPPGGGPVLIERGARAARADVNAGSAQDVRSQLQRLLNEHPPALRTVLQADPSLLQGEYLASYPAMAAFVKDHPEVARDPAFFFGQQFYYPRSAQERAQDTFEGVAIGVAVFTVAITAILILGWIVRQALHQRRWTRQSKIQTEMQTKILDRLQSSEDLLAYIQAPVGRHILEGAPLAPDEPARTPGSPYGRILWSAQIGVVLVAFGVGLWLAEGNAAEAIAPAFRTFGILATALGFGALLSGLASYLLSLRFGLIGPRG